MIVKIIFDIDRFTNVSCTFMSLVQDWAALMILTWYLGYNQFLTGAFVSFFSIISVVCFLPSYLDFTNVRRVWNWELVFY